MKTFRKIMAIALAGAALILMAVTATAESAATPVTTYTPEGRESLEDAIRRLQRERTNSGARRPEERKREEHERPPIHHRKKPESARKRKY